MEGIDETKVGEWFEANVAEATPPLAFELIAGGRSNLTYRVTDSVGNDFVLRVRDADEARGEARAVVVGGGVRYEGRRLLPDVDESCEEVAGWITPRVGGVGPTTIAMLFRNAVEAAERRAGIIESSR